MSGSQGAQQSGTAAEFNMDLSNFDLSDFMNAQLQSSSSSNSMEDIFGSGGNGNGNRGNSNGGGPGHMVCQYETGGGGRHQQLEGHDSMDLSSNSDAMRQNQQRQQLIHLAAMQASSQSLAVGGTAAQQAPIQQSQAIVTTESLRQQLQQQLKLQQLQQLQNQILQQQIELITGQSQSQKEVLMHGLLTPTSSSELRPTMNHSDFVSPMALHGQQRQGQFVPNPNSMIDALASPAMTPIQNNQNPLATMSAPPAFHHQHHMGSGPMDMFSPLTSPALGPTMAEGSNAGRQPYLQGAWSSSTPSVAASSTVRQPHDNTNSLELQHHLNMIQHQRQANGNHNGNPNKRPISEDPAGSTRKRPSPLASITSSPQTVLQQQAAQRKTRSQRPGGGRGHQASLSTSSDLQSFNAQSPIDCDVSMPPPAPPASLLPPIHSSSGLSSSTSRSVSTSPNLEPVTPASILSLGSRAREPTGLMPTPGGRNEDIDVPMLDHLPSGPMTAQQQLLAEALTRAGVAAEGANSGGSPIEETVKKGKGKGVTGAGSRSTKPSPAIKAGTSTPKTILPSGMSVEAAAQLSQKTMMEGRTAGTRSKANNKDQASASSSSSPATFNTTAAAAANEPPKTKTSHKAAEQKRRDSLKAGFDDLRLLLPPIIVDPDSDEALLPGSAPPRGPQRNLNNLPPGSEDHPNRGVSKLALLRCSNEFIARLNRRVERRDVEIKRLRDEIGWYRERSGLGPSQEAGEDDGEMREWVDLDMDLDEVEREDPTSSNPKAKVNGVGVSLMGSPVVTGSADVESKWPTKSKKVDVDGESGEGG
ncbi:hypothetical protein FRB97_004098 [Tulasnella sp. 331]|nr:hypothetical protein FRB97_004098 [Tulasnella sp. 331]